MRHWLCLVNGWVSDDFLMASRPCQRNVWNTTSTSSYMVSSNDETLHYLTASTKVHCRADPYFWVSVLRVTESTNGGKWRREYWREWQRATEVGAISFLLGEAWDRSYLSVWLQERKMGKLTAESRAIAGYLPLATSIPKRSM